MLRKLSGLQVFCAGNRRAVCRASGVCRASCLACMCFAPASASCYLGSRVAPVRGGTYFSLPPQRKVGKRKRLTPLAHLPIHGPPTSPRFTRQRPCSRALPTLQINASPASNTRARASGSEWFVPPRWQTLCRLSRRMRERSYRVECMRHPSEVRRVEHRGPTHSLPPGRRWTIWHGMLRRGGVKRVRRIERTLATHANRYAAV
ncbi:hypothetical protein PMI06_009254 [Burkholderia sp. BT03]|nr:hypothetical protein PMI06_009254 [Burkholderia sp. BT03]SKC95204.1 hypothetical protein SAMN06266956_6830 [Paraburkholderia hospita]